MNGDTFGWQILPDQMQVNSIKIYKLVHFYAIRYSKRLLFIGSGCGSVG